MYSRGPSFFHYRGNSICPWASPTNTHPLVCGETPRMKASNNMNVWEAQNAAASTFASSATASTAAAQAAQITSFFQPEQTASTQPAPATAPPAAVDLTAAAAAGTATGANMTATASPHQQPVVHSLSAARTSTADESTRTTSQASQLVDLADQEPSAPVGTEERSM